jgi:hypothetical protein
MPSELVDPLTHARVPALPQHENRGDNYPWWIATYVPPHGRPTAAGTMRVTQTRRFQAKDCVDALRLAGPQCPWPLVSVAREEWVKY